MSLDLRAIALAEPFEHPDAFGADGSNAYYGFLGNLVVAMRPSLVVELGTCTGGSTSYLASAGAQKVVSVDIVQSPAAIERLSRFDNVDLWHCDTRDPSVRSRLETLGPIDLLFIDTLHTPEQAGFELETYGPLVRSGGVILFDDIRIDSAMSAWWDSLPGNKIELPWLHWSGFGSFTDPTSSSRV